jgi:hypothetical protein
MFILIAFLARAKNPVTTSGCPGSCVRTSTRSTEQIVELGQPVGIAPLDPVELSGASRPLDPQLTTACLYVGVHLERDKEAPAEA